MKQYSYEVPITQEQFNGRQFTSLYVHKFMFDKYATPSEYPVRIQVVNEFNEIFGQLYRPIQLSNLGAGKFRS